MSGPDEVRATMWQEDGAWRARVQDAPEPPVSAPTREACLAELRRRVGPGPSLTVEVLPTLAGVAEAAAIMGWDKRRVITYLNRRSFPEPFAALASGRVWRREDVEAFAEAWRGRQAARRSRRPPLP